MLCKFSWTTSKIRAMGNRAIENRVRRGMPVEVFDYQMAGFRSEFIRPSFDNKLLKIKTKHKACHFETSCAHGM